MRHPFRRMVALALLLALWAGGLFPCAAAQEAGAGKLVRVGWYESSFCHWDSFGRRTGIDYEYQHKISAYTGWTYEYVEDSWSNLLQKLMAGEIDLLSDVSYKPERAEYMLYPDLPMGSESYYIYIDSDNRSITAEDLSTFNGKRIGVNKGSIQEGFLADWAERNSLEIEIVLLDGEESHSLTMLARGLIDGFATIYTVGDKVRITPVSRIGSSDFYYAVNKNRPDLLAELNMALAGIQDEEPYFSQQISQAHHFVDQTEINLTAAQEDWLATHGPIRIGYQQDYLPFCQIDRETGELAGALKDFLAHAANSLRRTSVRFEAVPYATTADALQAMRAGKVDCVFPVNLSSYDADQQLIRLTSPAMKTGMNVVTRASDDLNVTADSTVTFALPAGNPNVETFVMDQYPASRRVIFGDEAACYQAVASGMADCALISNYRVSAAEKTLTKLKLFYVPTGEHMEMSFAVSQANRELYFIMNKAVAVTPAEEMDAALASYMRTDRKVTFLEFLQDNWLLCIAALSVVFLIILVLLWQRLKAERRANEQQRLLEEAAEIAELKQTISSLLDNMPGMTFTKDAKTGAYLACNQAFADYVHKRSPEDVVGLTAAELLDADAAKRVAEDDRMALSMDGPYVFFEDVPYADGNPRQVKTTKLKYTDAAGRLCVLGISVDVTADTVHIHRGDATTKESYEKMRGAGVIYARIAQALARGYTDLYYINLDTEEFVVYRTDGENGTLTEARRGWHFFEECQEETDHFVFAEDREALKRALDRRTLIAELDQNDTFMMTYRLIGEEGPVYVSMKVTRMRDDDRFIILGVTDINEQMKQRNAALRAAEEQIAYNRLSALAGEYLCVYVADPETGRYREFTSTSGYQAAFAQAKSGQDFFEITRQAAREFSHPDDLNRFLTVFTRENILSEIERYGIFTVSYRLMIDGKPRYVRLKAAMVQEKEGPRLIIGINDIDAQVQQEERYVKHLAKAQIEANVDALTGVKNRHAYLLAEERLNAQIAADEKASFAIVILDINDLKTINDTAGHNAGDQLIRDACRIICNIFKHSPVFRIGGDEFAVIAQGEDYASIEELILRVRVNNEEALRHGGVVIACGMARREKSDTSVAPVFERADAQMYQNKTRLKEKTAKK